MKHASLFSGIGGFDLAAHWMGWENVFHCEIDPFCREVLQYHFPESLSYENIITTDFTEYGGGSISLPADSHVNHSALPEKEKVQQTVAISGQRCLEQYDKLNPGMSWGKTFAVSLIGTTVWYSNRCVLTWKLKDMKCSRFLFQLAASTTPRTGGKGSGLLPTPTVQESYGITNLRQSTIKNLSKGWLKDMSLTHYMVMNLLPTPIASDHKGGVTRPDPKRQFDTLAHGAHALTGGKPGTTSQLNPRFVAEMMGFPPNWTELPFLSGGKKV